MTRDSKGEKDRRSVNWRNASDTEDFMVMHELEEHHDEVSVKSDGGFAISQWPSFDTLVSKRQSSIIPSISRTKSSRKLAITLKQWCSCSCADTKKTITGTLEGPMVHINTSIRPVEYFSTYQGNINPEATAIIAKDGTTTYTYERLNLISDHFAFILKPLVEMELQSGSFADLREHEPCIGVALSPSEKCVITILAIWKLGLPYLPMHTKQNPSSRISTIIDALKPVMAIGLKADKELRHSTKGKCKIMIYEDLWSSMEKEIEKSNSRKFSSGERMKLLIGKLRGSFHHDPFHSCLGVFHRFNGKGEVMPIYINSCTAWCLVNNEWDGFPFTKDEKAALYISTDSHEFLWQMLSPLLAGVTLVVMNSQDIFGLIENTKKWNIGRLIVYPLLLRSLVTLMEVVKLNPLGDNMEPIFQTVKFWFCTGAYIRRELAISFFKIAPSDSALVNLYGCSEMLSFVCYKKYKSVEEVKKGIYYDIIPIGTPVMNTRIYIFDALGKMTDGSTLGEIYVSGLGVSSDLGVHVSSFSQTTDEIGPATMPNHYFEETKDDGMFKTLLRTGDYGRIVNISNGRFCFAKEETTVTFTGHTEGEIIIENYRININEINRHLKSCTGVKGCHVIVYRPGTPFKEILAFIVTSQKNSITKEAILGHLRRQVPESMVPTLIFIPGIPVKNFKVNKPLLIEFYQRETITKRKELISALELEFHQNPTKVRIMKLLFTILFKECSLSTRWTSNNQHWELASLVIPELAKPAIHKELIRNGFNIGVQELFFQKSVYDILLSMIKYNESKNNCANKVDESDDYVVEVLTNNHKKEFITFFARSNCGTRYKSIAYYCAWGKQQIEDSIRDIWPQIIRQRYSILVRHKSTKKIVGAMLNVDHYEKNSSEPWAQVQYPTKHRCDFLDQIDDELTENGFIDAERPLDTLQNFYFVTEPTMYFNYDHCIHIQLTMYKEVLKIAQVAGFQSFYTVVFDYIIADNIVDALDFEIVDTKFLNLFTAKDGTKPFNLVPDAMNGIVLLKRL